jgi:ligand-binding sensor domain-containing protein
MRMLEKKEKVVRFLLILMFLLSFINMRGQQWLPDFKHYTTRDGLPSSEVYQITSDAQNNLWFVTDRGVMRYDGYSFRLFDSKDSLPENSVIKVYRDETGRVWFIGLTGLLSYYKGGKIIPFKYNPVITSKLGMTIITSLYVSKDETVFFNAYESSTYTIDPSGNFSVIAPETDTTTITIKETGPETVFTFFTFSKTDKPVTKLRIQSDHQSFDIGINESISYKHFSTTKLRNGDLVFYCGKILVRIHPDKSYEIKHFNSQVLNVFEDYGKDLWIGCHHDGVYVYDSLMMAPSHYLAGLSVSHIYNDYENGFWLSTLEKGIFYLPSKNNLCFSENRNILDEKIISVLNISDSSLIFATSKGILYNVNAISHTMDKVDLQEYADSSVELINSVYYNEGRKQLVIGAELGYSSNMPPFIAKWKELNLIILYSKTKFIQQNKNHLIGSQYSYVYSLNTDNFSFEHLNKTQFHATTLFKDSKGRLLAGGLKGLYIYDSGDFVPFDPANKTYNRRITDINEINRQYPVIATRSDGIILCDDTSSHFITVSDRLSSNSINNVFISDNIIWAGTNRGLNKISISGMKPFKTNIEYYNVSNGLISDEINDIALGNNKVYLATNEGLAVINEEKTVYTKTELSLYINSVKINDKDTSIASSYALKHNQNTINISFAGVSFRNSKNIIYRYRLLGLDTTWRITTNRDVQFTSLPDGEYEFQLTAQNTGKTSSIKPITIHFTISPPFYKTPWFLILLILGSAIIVTVIINIRIRGIRKKEEERTTLNKKFSELNLNALRSQMNPHFTFNVLNSIQFYIANNDPESAQLYIAKFSRLIRMILDHSRTEYITLGEEIKMLTLYIELEKLRFENKFFYTLRTDESLNSDAINIPGMLIQPFVENSIKHGIRFKKGEARIDISFKVSGSILICTITDNGIGRAEAAKIKNGDMDHKSAGTSIVSDRIEALGILFKGKLKNYTIDLKDENGNPAGTSVIIEIPFTNSSS